MTKELRIALEECLSRLEAGDSVEACLERYAALATEMRPLLEAAASVRRFQVEPHSPEAFQSGRARLRAAVAKRRAESGPGRWVPSWLPLRPAAALAVAAAVVVLALLAMTTGMFRFGASPTQAHVEGVVDSVENHTLRITTRSGQVEVTLNPDTPVIGAGGRSLTAQDLAPGTSVRIEVEDEDDGSDEGRRAVQVEIKDEDHNRGPGGGDD